jgi:hypothetical protein
MSGLLEQVIVIVFSLHLGESTLPSASLLSTAIYNWLSLSNRVHTFVLLSSTKRYKSFSDLFLSLLLLSLFMIDSAYFILSCVLSNDINPYLVVLP